MLSARFELAIFRVSGERIDQLSHESACLTRLLTDKKFGYIYHHASALPRRAQASHSPPTYTGREVLWSVLVLSNYLMEGSILGAS